MRRTEQLQGLRLMKFEDVYGRCYRGDLSQAEASEILGMSERTFRRWRERYEAEGAEGLYDRRLGRVSARRAPVDEVMRVLELFETRYPDFTAKHFHEKLVCEHGFGLSYNWLRLSLQAHGKIKPAPRRGAHRRKRPRRPVGGMMLHQDGSSHEWVAGQWWDLIVTMDDATSEVYSGFFVAEEGTMSTFRGLRGDRRKRAVLLALRRSGLALLAHARGRRRCGQDNPTQVGRALARRHRVDRGLFAQARGRSERMFGTLQKRLPQELRLAGIATMPRPIAFSRSSLAGSQRPLHPPGRGHRLGLRGFCRHARGHPLRPGGPRRRGRQHSALQEPHLQIPADRHRHHYVKAQVRVHDIPTATWPSSTDPGVWRAAAPTAKPSTTTGSRPRDPLRRDRAKPPQQKRSIHMVHKAVNSVCYRQSLPSMSARQLIQFG